MYDTIVDGSDFNSRPHEEVDKTTLTVRCACLHFNSRPHEEVDFLQSMIFARNQHFNSRPHEEVDSISFTTSLYSMTFQLTTSRRGRPCVLSGHIVSHHFNSRPHEEVDDCFIIPDYFYIISTHDLTKRSTFSCIVMVLYMMISTHDLTKRSTNEIVNNFSESQ